MINPVNLANLSGYVLIDTASGTLIDAETVRAVRWADLSSDRLDDMNEGSDEDRIVIAEDFGLEIYVEIP